MSLALGKITTFLIVVFAYLAFASPAYAYLDPGSASLLVQLLVGSVAGGLIVVKIYWVRLKRLFRRSPEAAGPAPDPNTNNGDRST